MMSGDTSLHLAASHGRLSFPPFEIDVGNQQLWCGNELVPLRPRTFAVLDYLVQRAGQLVTKEEILGAVWPGLFVTDEVLTVCISELRKALGDTARTSRYVETAHRRGYRFLTAVRRQDSDQPVAASSMRASRSDFVGRDAELFQLKEAWRRARSGERQVVFVTGEPGIGKSALAQVFIEAVSANRESASPVHAAIAEGQCVESFGAQEAYLPFLEALGRLARDTGSGRIGDLLQRHLPSWCSSPQAQAELEVGSQRVTRRGSPEAMRRELTLGLEVLTQEVPLILVLEDLQWSDQSTVDMLAAIAQHRQPARLLIIATYRPADLILSEHRLLRLKQELDRKRFCAEISLQLLREPDVLEYLRSRLGSKARATELAPLVHQHSDGNPLFMVTLVDHILATGVDDLEALTRTLPQGLEPLIQRQIEACSAEERSVLQAASVVGPEFSVAALAATLDQPTTEVVQICSNLTRRHVLQMAAPRDWPDGSIAAAFKFRHSLYQQILYAGITAAARRALHRKTGLWLENTFAGTEAEAAGELAKHFGDCGDDERAYRYHRCAGERALQRHAYPEALKHLTAARQRLARLPQTAASDSDEFELLMLLIPLLMDAQGYSNHTAGELCVKLQRLCERRGDYVSLAIVLGRLELARRTRGEVAAADSAARRLLALADRRAEVAICGEAFRVMGCNRFWSADLMSARRYFESALAMPREVSATGSRRLDAHIFCASYLATLLWLLGYPEQGRAMGERAIALAEASDHPPSVALGYVLTSWLFVLRGDLQKVDELTEAGLAVCREHSFGTMRSVAEMLRAWSKAQRGAHTGAIGELRAAIATFNRVEVQGSCVDYQILLAELLIANRQPAAAGELLEQTLADQQRFGVRYFEPEIHRLRGEAQLAATGEVDSAVGHMEKALALAQSQQSRGLALRAAMSLMRVPQRHAERRGQRRTLELLYRSFDEGQETPDLREAALLLAHG